MLPDVWLAGRALQGAPSAPSSAHSRCHLTPCRAWIWSDAHASESLLAKLQCIFQVSAQFLMALTNFDEFGFAQVSIICSFLWLWRILQKQVKWRCVKTTETAIWSFQTRMAFPTWDQYMCFCCIWQLRTGAMMIQLQLLSMMLGTLSFQELRDVHGLTQLELPWVLIELVIWAMICRRAADFEVPPDVMCIEFFAGPERSSQIAKAFSELGFNALAFDVLRSSSNSISSHECLHGWLCETYRLKCLFDAHRSKLTLLRKSDSWFDEHYGVGWRSHGHPVSVLRWYLPPWHRVHKFQLYEFWNTHQVHCLSVGLETTFELRTTWKHLSWQIRRSCIAGLGGRWSTCLGATAPISDGCFAIMAECHSIFWWSWRTGMEGAETEIESA